mmetsp:Transcript_4197/g.13046  ORF Transcript_4197/g.13046 Transcript_4197/m.13046 type:complete len:287 (+) Transcript_4197:197-1057(+)
MSVLDHYELAASPSLYCTRNLRRPRRLLRSTPAEEEEEEETAFAASKRRQSRVWARRMARRSAAERSARSGGGGSSLIATRAKVWSIAATTRRSAEEAGARLARSARRVSLGVLRGVDSAATTARSATSPRVLAKATTSSPEERHASSAATSQFFEEGMPQQAANSSSTRSTGSRKTTAEIIYRPFTGVAKGTRTLNGTVTLRRAVRSCEWSTTQPLPASSAASTDDAPRRPASVSSGGTPPPPCEIEGARRSRSASGGRPSQPRAAAARVRTSRPRQLYAEGTPA